SRPATTPFRQTPISSVLARWASGTRPPPQVSPLPCSRATERRVTDCDAGVVWGDGARWAGRGTGLGDEGLARKCATIDAGLERHRTHHADPLHARMLFGGRELTAILGATLAARHQQIPVLLDGFIATAAAAPLAHL